MTRSTPAWQRCTSTIDAVFAQASHGSRTLEALLAVLETRPTQNSARLMQKHPDLAALVAHMAQMAPAEAETLASRLHRYILTEHAVQACQLDHVQAMEQYLRTEG